MRNTRAFTLVELMVVLVIIGTLAALALPTFGRLRLRAQEAGVRENAHTLQVVAEDFAAQNDGVYARDATSTLPNGNTIPDLLPAGTLENPFDVDAVAVVWTGPPTVPGEVGYDTAGRVDIGYVITGQGAKGLDIIMLSNGH